MGDFLIVIQNYSDDGFWVKIKGVIKSAGRVLIYKALQLFYVMKKPDCPTHIKAIIVAALGYFILPLDVIFDFIINWQEDSYFFKREMNCLYSIMQRRFSNVARKVTVPMERREGLAS